MNQIVNTVKTIFSKRDYLAAFPILISVLFLFFVLIQVWTIPGNNLILQLSVFRMRDYALTAILSFLVSLFLVMQAFIFRNAYNTKAKLATAGSGGVGGFMGVAAAVLGTATCTTCIAALFGFLGFGGVVFLFNNRWPLVTFGIVIILFSLYFSSRKVNGVCDSCRVDKRSLK